MDIRLQTIPVINHYCNRIVYFALPVGYCTKGKPLEQIYDDAKYFSFVKNNVSKYCISHNLKNKEL